MPGGRSRGPEGGNQGKITITEHSVRAIGILWQTRASQRPIIVANRRIRANWFLPTGPRFIPMLCPACHTEIPTDSAFCPKCGQPVSLASAPPATPVDKLRSAQTASAVHAEPEHELWRGSFSGKALYGSWILAAIVSLAAVIAAILVPNSIAWMA